jgi:hypothetical protein
MSKGRFDNTSRRHPAQEGVHVSRVASRVLRALVAFVVALMAVVPLALVASTETAAAAATDVKINEVESSGGVPGDWVELYNTGAASVDISGEKFLDNDNSHTPYTIPSGTVLAPGAYLTLEESQFVFGLGSADSARLYAPDGTTLIDSYSWTSHATTTYGRCPNGTGSFTTTASVTKGAANDCGTPVTTTTTPSTASPWPGDAAVQTVDNSNVFGGNLSGLDYEGSGSATPGVIWGARNGPGSLFRLIFDGTHWVPDPANNWGAGKLLRYPGGGGEPDAEGAALEGPTSANGVYVAAERDNTNNSVSRNSILRYEVSAAGTSLTATNEWNLTSDLPVTGANLGAEAITWIPDSFLTANGFFDETKNHTYNPSEYPNHGAGLFFVGLEANGMIYAYALDHTGSAFARVATISSGFPGVMDLQFDRDTNDLWAVCDDTCQGQHKVLRIDPTTHKFTVAFTFDRPAGMPNLNNEGFTIASATECVNDRKPVFWSDDSETGGHALRSGNLPCSGLGVQGGLVPEFPIALLPVGLAVALIALWFVFTRRRRLA